MGWPEGDSKERALIQLAALLEENGVRYAVIGGVAIQIWTAEPRTTRDIDVALRSYDDLPAAALLAAGFLHEGRFAHSDNWRSPGSEPSRQRTAIQFTSDPLTANAVDRAELYDILGGPKLRVASLVDLLHLKLEAACEPERLPSKRTSDLADVQRLIEEHPDLAADVPNLAALIARVHTLMLDDARRLGR